MFQILKTDYSQLWFLYKSDFRISTARQHIEALYNPFKPKEKRQYSPQYCSN